MMKRDVGSGHVEALQALFARYQANRPPPDRNLDQFYATTDTVIRRAALLASLPGISESSLVFLGDDDLTSIALASLATPKRLVVIDIDRRLIDYIRHVAAAERLKIEVVEHDLRTPIPKTMLRDAEVAFFDPPYTPQGLGTWLARAFEATLGSGRNQRRKDPTTLARKRYYCCYGYTDRSTERGLKIQRLITDRGCLISEKIRAFNEYIRAPGVDSRSDLYVLQPTPQVDVRMIDAGRSGLYTGRRPRS